MKELYKMRGYILTQQSVNDWAEIEESVNELIEVIKSLQELSDVLPAVCAFVVGYIPAILIAKAIENSKKQKIEKAKELGQVVKAKLCGEKRRYISNHRDSRYNYARYSYVINGKERKTKFLRFYGTGTHTNFRDYIYVYFLGRKVYTDYDQPKWYMILVYLLPFLIGALVMYITNPGMVL